MFLCIVAPYAVCIELIGIQITVHLEIIHFVFDKLILEQQQTDQHCECWRSYCSAEIARAGAFLCSGNCITGAPSSMIEGYM